MNADSLFTIWAFLIEFLMSNRQSRERQITLCTEVLVLSYQPVSSDKSMSISLSLPCPVLVLMEDSRLTTEHIGLHTKDWLSAYFTMMYIFCTCAIGGSSLAASVETLLFKLFSKNNKISYYKSKPLITSNFVFWSTTYSSPLYYNCLSSMLPEMECFLATGWGSLTPGGELWCWDDITLSLPVWSAIAAELILINTTAALQLSVVEMKYVLFIYKLLLLMTLVRSTI